MPQIVYFPYLNLKKRDEIRFGNIRVWNFDLLSVKEIPDEKLREKITRLINSNLLRGKPLKGIGVVSIGETNFHEFNSEETETVEEIRLLLFLGFISKNNVSATGPNAGHYVATSENFTNVTQNFEVDSEYISERSGYLVSRLNGGYKIGELLFHTPSYVPEPLGFGIDEELISELLKLKRKSVRSYSRILRATELLFESFFNDPFVSLNARILLQVCSFEILLNLPNKDQRKVFKEKVKKYIVREKEKEVTYFSERYYSKVKEVASLKVVWADKLYTLRNYIIHGSRIVNSAFFFKNKQHYLDISPLFFVLLVKEVINEKRRNVKKYFNDDIKWDKFEDSQGNERFGFVYVDTTVVRSISRSIALAYKDLRKKTRGGK